MWRYGAWGVVVCAACGRVDFASVSAASDADADAADAMTIGDDGMQLGTCPPGALLCARFEDPNTDTTIWNDTGGTFALDLTTAHRGAGSVKFTIGPGQPGVETGSYIGQTGSFVQTEPELWIRAWLRLSALPVSPNALQIIGVEQTGAAGDGIFIRSDDTEVYHQFDNMQSGAGATVPIDTWFCLVWHLQLAVTSTGSSEVTSDVLPPFSLNGQTNGAPSVDLLGFGPYFAAPNISVAQPAIDVWFDDLLVDNAPVSCAD